MKRNMEPTKELLIETMEKIVKFIQVSNPQLSVVKDVGCSLSTMSKIWCLVKKRKHTSKLRNTSTRQDRKLKAI